MATMGRPSVFRPKNPKKRFQGLTTTRGAQLFEQRRKQLAGLSGVKSPSDGDVFDYLARGEEETAAYLVEKAGRVPEE
jgi:hypothetical protein